MMRAQVFVSVLLLILISAAPAYAQRLVSALSEQDVAIDSNFTGTSLTIFGNVEPRAGEDGLGDGGPFDIVITISGPPATHTVREKTRQLGIWLNSRAVDYEGVPSYFQILASRELTDISENPTLDAAGINPAALLNGGEGPRADQLSFLPELTRLMEDNGQFGIAPHAVNFMSPTFYRARVELPANIPNGTFLAKTYLFSGGEMIEERAIRFFVHTTGVERFLERAATDQPFAYGLACVVLALFTGWLGSVAFKR